MKSIEDQLKDIGMKISSLETKKATAIVADNFKAAKRWNDEIDKLRTVAHEKLENAPDIYKYRQVFSVEKDTDSIRGRRYREGQSSKHERSQELELEGSFKGGVSDRISSSDMEQKKRPGSQSKTRGDSLQMREFKK